MRTTVASVWAGINSIESSRGARTPIVERTWRTRGPRLTVSVQMVERSTVGAAGLRRKTIAARTAMTITAAPAQSSVRRFFFCLMSGRAISIAEEGSKQLAKAESWR